MHGVGFIRNYPGSYVLSAPSLPPTSAIIFVHGFGGNATDTWQHVPELVDVEPYRTALAHADLFFYDYECTRHEIPYSADDLNNFITQILTDRKSIRTGRPPYHAIHLIGHSAGAVVVRQLVLELFNGNKYSPYKDLLLNSTNPVLFGSAQAGFKHEFAALMIVNRVPFLDVAAAIWLLWRGKVYKDLRPHSAVLTALEGQTKDLWHTDKCPGFRPLTAWGKDEQIVHPIDYLRDVRIDLRPGRDHFSICKPTRSDPLALKWITDSMTEVPNRAAPK
jgi:pimeloyl-ACP methyl ester carboxylesterase